MKESHDVNLLAAFCKSFRSFKYPLAIYISPSTVKTFLKCPCKPVLAILLSTVIAYSSVQSAEFSLSPLYFMQKHISQNKEQISI